MKVSEQWLREWVNPDISAEELIAQLTMAGLEVDALESLVPEFTHVVVGEIIAIEQHPDADKLRVCQVNNGEETVQIVCGAANAALGLKAPLANIGAQLPGDFKIKKSKLRGVESFGMLCGETELKLGDDDSGLMELPSDAPVGSPLGDYLKLNDRVIELDITPNRGDCFSVIGIAREVGVINKVPVAGPAFGAVAPTIDDTVSIRIDAGEQCPRWVGRVVRNVDVSKPTPLWMVEKLRRGGIRSIDPVVDVTNYVLLELGQPMHAFDLNTIDGGIVVRLAEQGEKITLLDGTELEPGTSTLVIADHKAPRALAGIMGGENSGVSPSTQDILLESALFAPTLMAGKARNFGLQTDSSHRFERGVDSEGQVRAIERATQLLLEITGGDAGPVIEQAVSEHLPKPATILLRRERIRKTLGLDLADGDVVAMMTGLGFQHSEHAEGWQLLAPSWRYDMAIEADLLEEVARIYGYNRLPVKPLVAPIHLQRNPEEHVDKANVRRLMTGRGYQEAITYSFVEPGMQALFNPEAQSIALANPISADMAVMRTSLWPGLATTVINNLNRQQSRVRLFETGLRFIKRGEDTEQTPMIAAACCGGRYPGSPHTGLNPEPVDFFDLKGDLEALFELGGQPGRFRLEAARHPALHDGQSARVLCDGREIGWIGMLHPSQQQSLGLSQALYLMEVELAPLLEARLPEFTELSRFPEVRRDISLVVDEELPVQALLDTIASEGVNYLQYLTLFDTYQGKGIEKQRKSVTFGLTFQESSRTLNDEEINESIDQIVGVLERQHGASLRN